MNKFSTVFLFVFIGLFSFGQNKNRTFFDVNYTEGDFLTIKVNDGLYKIQFYTKDIVETTFIPKGEQFDGASHAVILQPKKVDVVYSYSPKNDNVFFKAKEGITVKIQKHPFQISYVYKDKPIISEKAGYVKNDSLETIQFNLTKDEVLYGGGARALGMNRRGNRLQLYNRAHYGYETRSELMNYTMPIVLSSNQYMIHFDNAPIGFLDLDSKGDNTLAYETISGRKTYQVIVSENWYDLLDNYTNLTGKQPMLPRWALGNFSSRFGYHSQNEVETTINKFKEDKIPVDAVILDLYWFGKEVMGTMGNLEFDKDSFPNPKQMIKNLRDNNVETILITEPFILTTSKKWDEAVKEDILAKDSLGNPFTYNFFFGNTALIDIYNPKGAKWFKKIYKDLSKMGVTGFWGDLGEPEVHPKELLHATGTANELHNIYGHNWAELVYEASKEMSPNKRPFILMRAGYSGSQRFGMVPWSGDVNRTWGGLQSQPEIALQMGMQGLAYMHSDLGGFAGANLDEELYVRWLQYGVFQPIYRPHAQEEVPSEPVFRSEKAKVLAKKAIELRYKLLPYNYNLIYENNQFGKPLMRPLFFEEPNTPSLYGYSKTYLWGHDILVSPVLEQGKTEQEMYFPKNAIWFNFYSDEKVNGGQTKKVLLNQSSIPTYVRAGAFVPMAKPMQSTKAYNANHLDVHYYFDESVKESEAEFYNDDGALANAFKANNYEILECKAEFDKNHLKIEFEAILAANYSSQIKNFNLIVHNIQKQPKRINVGVKKVHVEWDSKTKLLTVPVVWEASKGKKVQIKFKN